MHRAQIGSYNGKKQISVNVCFNSSWAMFAPQVYGSAPSKTVNEESKAVEEVWADDQAKEFDPVRFFGARFTFDRAETKLIREVRKWAATSF